MHKTQWMGEMVARNATPGLQKVVGEAAQEIRRKAKSSSTSDLQHAYEQWVMGSNRDLKPKELRDAVKEEFGF